MKLLKKGISDDGSVDFYIGFDAEVEEYVVDIFNAKIQDKNAAYIETFECETLEESLDSALTYQLHVYLAA